jgi:ABC-type glycerol-3-phosphate transport system permease component
VPDDESGGRPYRPEGWEQMSLIEKAIGLAVAVFVFPFLWLFARSVENNDELQAK